MLTSIGHHFWVKSVRKHEICPSFTQPLSLPTASGTRALHGQTTAGFAVGNKTLPTNAISYPEVKSGWPTAPPSSQMCIARSEGVQAPREHNNCVRQQVRAADQRTAGTVVIQYTSKYCRTVWLNLLSSLCHWLFERACSEGASRTENKLDSTKADLQAGN